MTPVFFFQIFPSRWWDKDKLLVGIILRLSINSGAQFPLPQIMNKCKFNLPDRIPKIYESAISESVNIPSRFMGVTVYGIWTGELDLLTPYTHHSELQAIIAQSLFPHFTNYHNIGWAFSSLLCLNNRSLATASNNGDSSASRAHIVTVRRISRKWTALSRPGILAI
jgi:hypothetical protein